MKKILLIFAVFLIAQELSAQGHPAYQLFNKKGKPVNYGKMVKALEEADIILFGEQHNNALNHWLQLQVTKSIHAKHPVTLGAEMFEADDQVLLDEYLADLITENHFITEGKTWKNYKTDYKPLLDYAKENELRFIATNIPRRYASLVNKEGLEGLNQLVEEAKNWIAPLPIEVDLEQSGYKWMIETMGKHAGGDPANIARSQASKDATMAHFILKSFETGKKFIHYHGSFHSKDFQGIYHYLLKANLNLKVMTIASHDQDDIKKLAEENIGIVIEFYHTFVSFVLKHSAAPKRFMLLTIETLNIEF